MQQWDEIQRRVERIERFARWMDDRVAVPGTRIRLGLDSIIGLIPGVGDLTTGAAGLWLVIEGARLGMPKRIVIRMLINLIVDTVGGAVPIAGDLFDILWKSNRRNAELIRRHLESRMEGETQKVP